MFDFFSFAEMKQPAHRRLHPFGQIPYEEGDLTIFESGAIVFHIAERHPGLMPDDPNARTRAIHGCSPRQHGRAADCQRSMAVILEQIRKTERGSALGLLDDRVRVRLGENRPVGSGCGRLGWTMCSAPVILLIGDGAGQSERMASAPMEKHPNLIAYVARGEARPRLQACFRRSVGGFHWQATDELIGKELSPCAH